MSEDGFTGTFRTRHLAIVGLGLMGGSLALALRPHIETIVACDPNPASREYALANGIVDEATDDLREAVSDAETVVMAAPVRTIIQIITNRIGAYLRSNTLLIDMGSTKQDICTAMGHLPVGIHAIGGHPMAGKERSGIAAADADLYRDRPFVLCPTRRTTPATRLRALSFVEALGAVPIEMDALRHDRIVATISHLPYLLSVTLVATAAHEAEQDDAVWRLAASGFRDMSRLAGSDVQMIGDILSTNTQAVATLLAEFRMQLAMLETLLISRDEQKLVDALTPIREKRLQWAEEYEQKRTT
ncbi:MAG: prephenate dehydrogenase [Chloroflexi bacterium]|nr:MAG: prephenate dehydrogenase [Chloroflexota bacterium]